MNANNMLQSALKLTGVSLLSRLLYYLYQVYLTKIVGTECLGFMHMITPLYYTLLSFFTSGFAQCVCRLTAQAWTKRNITALETTCSRVNRTFISGFTLSIPLLCVILLFLTRHNPELFPFALPILLLLLFCTAQEIFQKEYFFGVGNLTIPSALQITEQIVRIIAVLGLLSALPFRNRGGVLIVLFTGMLLSELYSSLHLFRLRKKHILSVPFTQVGNLRPEMPSRNTILRIAIPISLTAILSQSISSLNAAILPHLLTRSGMTSQAALSVYGTLFGMTLPFLSLPTALTGSLAIILLPCLSGHHAMGNKTAFIRTLSESVKINLAIVTPLTIGLAILSPVIGPFLFHEVALKAYFLPMAICIMLSAIDDLIATALNACNRQVSNTIITVLCAATQMGLTIACTPSMGLSGYVVGLFLSTLLSAVFRLIALFRSYSSLNAPRLSPSTCRTTPDTGTGAHTRRPSPG